MALTVNQLGTVRAELYDACTKWYDIGLALDVPVTTLDSVTLDGLCGSMKQTICLPPPPMHKIALKCGHFNYPKVYSKTRFV